MSKCRAIGIFSDLSSHRAKSRVKTTNPPDLEIGPDSIDKHDSHKHSLSVENFTTVPWHRHNGEQLDRIDTVFSRVYANVVSFYLTADSRSTVSSLALASTSEVSLEESKPRRSCFFAAVIT